MALARNLPAALCFSLISSTASAQADPLLFEATRKMFGTIYAKADRLTSAGALTGCSIEYALLHPDWTYSQGRPLAVRGSFGLYRNSNVGAVFGLKIILADQYIEGGQLISKHKRASTAFLETASGVSNASSLASSHESDVEGGMLFIFSVGSREQLQVLKAILDNDVRLVFNRSDGGADIRVPIDLMVTDVDIEGRRKRDDQTLNSFARCSSQFLDSVKNRLEERSRKP